MQGDAMADRILDERRNGLEEAFFAQHNEMLRRRLQEADAGRNKREALAAASGLRDEAVLDRLVAMDVSPQTLSAFSLIPLAAVAWADGAISEEERKAVLQAASRGGLDETGHGLLEGWLRQRPGTQMMELWRDYAAALQSSMDAPAREALRAAVLGQAREVAEAAGGFLGLGRRVSASEQAVLDDLAAQLGG
jgi:tellurite resistance protein